MADYQLFDSNNSMAIGFSQPVILDLTPLQLKSALLKPGDRIFHLGGKYTSASYWTLDFPDSIKYQGLYHTNNDDGLIACFTQGLRRPLEGFAEWYYCYHWMPEYQCFLWTSAKNRSVRTIETDNAKIIEA